MISLYYGNWDYWNLGHKVTFDGPNRLILINDGVIEIDIQRDIYSAWKEWSLIETNTRYLQALSTVGGEPTVAGQRLDVTYFLINGWRIKPYPGSYQLNLIGNIFEVNGGDIKVPADVNPLFPNNISINTSTSVIVRQVDSGGGSGATSSLTPDESAALFNIEDKVIEIRNILNYPVEATLVASQEQALLDIQAKILELWKLHGLDPNNDLTVSQDSRIVDNINQQFDKQPDGSIIIRRT
jgi:hypothetical protein